MSSSPLHLLDYHPQPDDFASDVLRGLSHRPRTLPCKYFYDERGSALFDAICELPEYYPTRTESRIMRDHVDEMVDAIGPDALLVEYGSGSSTKTRILLDAIEQPAGYVPIDISREHLLKSAASLAERYPELEILPVCADYTRPFNLPRPSRPARSTVVYFPGSTIGNFLESEAVGFLRNAGKVCGRGGAMLIGVDLDKSPDLLVPAYDDAAGVTAEFNLNLLRRINRELGGDFDLGAFRHEAKYNSARHRVEMHLVSARPQLVRVAGRTFAFDEGETIHTECSHKYTTERFAAMAGSAGFRVEQVWTDERNLFSVQYLRRLPAELR